MRRGKIVDLFRGNGKVAGLVTGAGKETCLSRPAMEPKTSQTKAGTLGLQPGSPTVTHPHPAP